MIEIHMEQKRFLYKVSLINFLFLLPFFDETLNSKITKEKEGEISLCYVQCFCVSE